jgi:hypothetical protein
MRSIGSLSVAFDSTWRIGRRIHPPADGGSYRHIEATADTYIGRVRTKFHLGNTAELTLAADRTSMP